MKDVRINYNRYDRDRIGDLILYHLGVVYYRGIKSRELCKSKFPIGLISRGHQSLRAKEVV